MCVGLGARPEDLAKIRQCPALQPNPKVEIIQQDVHDSGFIHKTTLHTAEA